MKDVQFSARTGWDTGESALAEAVRQARAANVELLDLTLSNPTRCGFVYDAEAVLGPLADPSALVYDPDPRGIASAREAVAGYYREHGAEVAPEHVVLTTSTSEGYSFLFRVLCNAGDEVLVAQPSYPLFDFLATLDDVRLQPYPLFYDFGWWIDFAELERRIGLRTRAVLLVHPNNPTGHFTRGNERRRLEELCVRHGLALVVDEVFLDYPLEARSESFAVGEHGALTFVVSGLSKIAALPQMKAGWLAVLGPEAARTEALRRLEIVADTFLSMNAPAQLALPAWLVGRERVARQIRARVRENLQVWRNAGFEPLPVEAGWSAVLRLPGWLDAQPETLVRDLGVVVHAGEFYGMAGRGWIVVSLIVDLAVCVGAVGRMQAWRDREEAGLPLDLFITTGPQ